MMKLLTILLITLHSTFTKESDTKKTVLVFGGTGMVGIEVVHHLLQHNYKLTLVSRGNWRFDSGTLIKPYVKHISCDRYLNYSSSPVTNALKHCPELIESIGSSGQFDFVIDFSAYIPEVLEHAAEVLKEKVGLYIYISSHSVYEVCKRPKTLPIKETDSVRPYGETSRRQLIEANETNREADLKLQGEEFLMKQRKEGGFPFMILRLSDVIGPRDTSHRWWSLQLWIKHYHIIQVPFGLHRNPFAPQFRTSVVYTKDIAKAILSALEAGDVVHDQIYNIGYEDSFRYKEIILDINKELRIHKTRMKYYQEVIKVYPSVTIGPVDVSKIKQHLGLHTTKWEDVVRDNVEWYEAAFYDYPKDRKVMLEWLLKNIVPRLNRLDLRRELLMRIRDEL